MFTAFEASCLVYVIYYLQFSSDLDWACELRFDTADVSDQVSQGFDVDQGLES